MGFEVDSFMPTLGVPDLDAAIEFYDALGFREAWRYPDAGASTHAGIYQGNVTIMLSKVDGVIPQQVYAFVDGIDDMYEHCMSRCPDSLTEISDEDYGMRDFGVTDPWGHEITFGEAIERIHARHSSAQ